MNILLPEKERKTEYSESDMYRLLAFDIDNTLIQRGKATIEESALEAVKMCREKGYEIVISTGRTIKAVHPDIMKRMPASYFIGMNGACLNKMDGTVLRSFKMCRKTTERIIQIALEHDYPLGFKFDDSFQIYHRYDEFVRRYCKNGITESMLTDCSNSKDYHLIHEDPMDAFIYADDNMLPQYFPQFDDLRFVRANSRKIIYEAFNAKAGKGVMLNILREKLKIRPEEMIAFGDSENDIDMIKFAGLGIAMGNGTPECKATADYVTDSIDQDGIWKALRHFNII